MAEKLGLFEKKNWKFALFLVPVFFINHHGQITWITDKPLWILL